jgi:hypothetical protein
MASSPIAPFIVVVLHVWIRFAETMRKYEALELWRVVHWMDPVPHLPLQSQGMYICISLFVFDACCTHSFCFYLGFVLKTTNKKGFSHFPTEVLILFVPPPITVFRYDLFSSCEFFLPFPFLSFPFLPFSFPSCVVLSCVVLCLVCLCCPCFVFFMIGIGTRFGIVPTFNRFEFVTIRMARIGLARMRQSHHPF